MPTFVDKLEKRLGRYAISNLTFWIMVGQIAIWGFGLFTNFPVESLALDPSKVIQGEVWRIFTFLLEPPMARISLWLILIWYIFYFFGSTLEKEWGEFRYNLFILVGVLCTVIGGMLTLLIPIAGGYPLSNGYLLTSPMLAFAILFPNFEIRVYFILPVKMKWIAVFTLAAWFFGAGNNPFSWVLIFGALANIMLFFGKSFIQGQQAKKRSNRFHREREAEAAEPFHRCVICGKTDLDDRDMEFAYQDGKGYCRDHWDEMDK
ncbi:MAG: hypothetical protein AAFX93_04265 [Verrucomicrobiota bacterium]